MKCEALGHSRNGPGEKVVVRHGDSKARDQIGDGAALEDGDQEQSQH